MSKLIIPAGFQSLVATPLDDRLLVANLTELNSLPLTRRYFGLIVYVQDIQKYYYIKNNLSVFEEYPLGGINFLGTIDKIDGTIDNPLPQLKKNDLVIIKSLDLTASFYGGIILSKTQHLSCYLLCTQDCIEINEFEKFLPLELQYRENKQSLQEYYIFDDFAMFGSEASPNAQNGTVINSEQISQIEFANVRSEAYGLVQTTTGLINGTTGGNPAWNGWLDAIDEIRQCLYLYIPDAWSATYQNSWSMAWVTHTGNQFINGWQTRSNLGGHKYFEIRSKLTGNPNFYDVILGSVKTSGLGMTPLTITDAIEIRKWYLIEMVYKYNNNSPIIEWYLNGILLHRLTNFDHISTAHPFTPLILPSRINTTTQTGTSRIWLDYQALYIKFRNRLTKTFTY